MMVKWNPRSKTANRGPVPSSLPLVELSSHMSITLCTVARSGGKGNEDKNMYKQNGPYGSQIFLHID